VSWWGISGSTKKRLCHDRRLKNPSFVEMALVEGDGKAVNENTVNGQENCEIGTKYLGICVNDPYMHSSTMSLAIASVNVRGSETLALTR
jgi:hypothetical protein